MPARSEKQRRFFQAVKGAKHNPNAPEHLKKVAGSMRDKDIDDFIKCESDLKIKKAMLSVLKDVVEPMYLNEGDEGLTGATSVEPVSTTFNLKDVWATYIKRYVGQPFSPKEIEALGNFKEKQPTTTARTEIWFKTSDDFGISKTCVIKKMKDSGQFSYSAFQKQEKIMPDDQKAAEQQPKQEPQQPESPMGDVQPTPPSQQPKDESDKEDIIVTKSILFKDDIKGAGILVSFLKKLDL